MSESIHQHCKSCKSCPWSRKSKPGALGGSSIEKYVGQIMGPFFLPCHCVPGYKGNDTKLGDSAQCAGAAIFRANIGRAELMPGPLLKLFEHSDQDVFRTLEEFIEHHRPDLTEEEVATMASAWPLHLHREYIAAMGKGGVQKV